MPPEMYFYEQNWYWIRYRTLMMLAVSTAGITGVASYWGGEGHCGTFYPSNKQVRRRHWFPTDQKLYKNQFALGICPGPYWGNLQRCRLSFCWWVGGSMPHSPPRPFRPCNLVPPQHKSWWRHRPDINSDSDAASELLADNELELVMFSGASFHKCFHDHFIRIRRFLRFVHVLIQAFTAPAVK